MARYLLKGTARDGNGNIIASATISVYLAGTTTAASVYEAYSGGTAVNSVTSSSDGTFSFYVDDTDYTGLQRFKCVIGKTGYTSITYDYITIFDVTAIIDTDTTFASAADTVVPSKLAAKTYIDATAAAVISNTAYGSSWDTVTTIAPSKNAVYDKIETIVSDTSFGTSWDAVTTIAPSKNTVYDMLGNSIYMRNVGIAASVATKALTIALKGENGSDPSSTNCIAIKFRSSTLTTGTPIVRTVETAKSVVLPSGGTLGFTSALAGRIYVWAIDNSGTVELAVSRTADIFQESNLISTTAIGTGSDSATTMYSTSARTDVACRCIGYIEITTGATAGEWDNAPTKIQVMGPGVKRTGDIVQVVRSVTNTSGSTSTTIPWDNTKPQSSEGAAFLSRTIIPTSAVNKLKVKGFISFVDAQGTAICSMALFRDAGADAIAVGSIVTYATSIGAQINIAYEVIAGVTSETTFASRVGPHSGTMYWLRAASIDVYNGIFEAFLEVTEVFA